MSKRVKHKAKSEGANQSLGKTLSGHLADSAQVSRRAFLGRAGKVIALGAMSHFAMVGTASAAWDCCASTPGDTCTNTPADTCTNTTGSPSDLCTNKSTTPPDSCTPYTNPQDGCTLTSAVIDCPSKPGDYCRSRPADTCTNNPNDACTVTPPDNGNVCANPPYDAHFCTTTPPDNGGGTTCKTTPPDNGQGGGGE